MVEDVDKLNLQVNTGGLLRLSHGLRGSERKLMCPVDNFRTESGSFHAYVVFCLVLFALFLPYEEDISRPLEFQLNCDHMLVEHLLRRRVK